VRSVKSDARLKSKMRYRRKETIGGCTLYLGDCLEVMQELDGVDAVVTDPPYDKYTHTCYRLSDGGSRQKNKIDFDELRNYTWLEQLLPMCGGWVVAFCSLEMLGRYQSRFPDNYIRSGVWDKLDSNAPQFTGDRPAQGAEGIVMLHRNGKKQWHGRKSAVWRYSVNRKNTHHPTEKPVHLINAIIDDVSNIGDMIVDPFMGSGTHGVSCAETGRRYIGIEIDSKYYDIACERIDDATRQRHLFKRGVKKPQQAKLI
jgi:site-specific DNA-methyltransferase (adenine-specific)